MDGSRFDQLARTMAGRRTRRGFLGGLAGLAAGLVAIRDGDAACPPGAVAASGGRCLCKATGRAPINGSCGAGPGQTLCNGVAVDFSSDVNNCGSCGNVCPAATPGTCQGAPLCRAGICQPTLAAVGTPCNDGTVCTANDVCGADGVCRGTPISCDDGLSCTADTCDPVAGCLHAILPGTCLIAGACYAAGQPNPSNACQVCQPAVSQTAWSNLTNGTVCNDGNACTRTDTCQAGICVGSNPVVCQPLDQCHDAGTCDPATGTCSNPAKPNGTTCNDGNACTQTDTCQNGACVGSNPVVCTALDQCHAAGVCDPASGICSNPNKPDGTTCNDGSACTEGDTCQAGVCKGGAQKVCSTTNPCLTTSCDPALGCVTAPKPAGTACGDGNACNGNEVCDATGNCVAGTPVSCGPCTVCDTASGQCLPANEGGACPGDGNKCFGSFVCQGGTCTGVNPVVCAAPDQCHFAGSCDPATGVCSNPDKPDRTPCTDNNLCTSFDSCHAGVCTGDPVDCDDGLACTDDVCNPATGCTHVLRPGFCLIGDTCLAAGEACDDGNPCTSDAVCQANGTCAGTRVPCDDGLACTDDVCDVTGECLHFLQPGSCIIEGACYAAGALNPEQSCRHCDPTTDPLRWTTVSGGPCGDSACLTGATCVAGFCAGGTAATDGCAIGGVCYPASAIRPSNTCFVCDPARSKTVWSFRANGTPCDGLCRTDGTCQNGICAGGTVDSSFCHIDDVCIPAGATHPTFGSCWVCDPTRSAESWTVLDDDTPCPNRCLANPTCQAGVCTGEETVVCEPVPQICQRNVCDPATGTCVKQPTPDLRPDNRGCLVCPDCVSGNCIATIQLVCGPCQTCNVLTQTCSQNPAGTDCGSDCTTRRTCNAAGVCVENLGGCFNIGACEAKVCDLNTGKCVETGANDGKPCNDNPCNECRAGKCQSRCGECQTCDPAVGQCVTCEPCCGGFCGQSFCHFGDGPGPGFNCCPASETCCTDGAGQPHCQTPDKVCEGVCFEDAAQCCGRAPFVGVKRCGFDKICCNNDLINGCCDPATQKCGPFGCELKT